MARIQPILIEKAAEPLKSAFSKHVEAYKGRITNMKATVGHALLAFEVYMQWYPLYEHVVQILGPRLAYLYAFSISEASNCPLCSTFFRKIIIDAGEKPEDLQLTPETEWDAMLDINPKGASGGFARRCLPGGSGNGRRGVEGRVCALNEKGT